MLMLEGGRRHPGIPIENYRWPSCENKEEDEGKSENLIILIYIDKKTLQNKSQGFFWKYW